MNDLMGEVEVDFVIVFDKWEQGDLQWQNTLDESLTFWASEVSLQQQELKKMRQP